MALSEEEKKKMISAFHEDTKKAEDEEEYEDVWTDEEKLAIARKILKRMGLDEKYL